MKRKSQNVKDGAGDGYELRKNCQKHYNLYFSLQSINPLPNMPVLGSSTSAANKDMMSKTWTNGDTII